MSVGYPSLLLSLLPISGLSVSVISALGIRIVGRLNKERSKCFPFLRLTYPCRLDKSTKLHPLRSFSDPCYSHRAWWFFSRTDLLRTVDKESSTPLCPTYTHALSTTSSTRCHTQAVSSSDRSQSRCVEKPSLNAANAYALDEQSVNADVRELEYVCRGWTCDTMTKR